jgi:hypothetical protein
MERFVLLYWVDRDSQQVRTAYYVSLQIHKVRVFTLEVRVDTLYSHSDFLVSVSYIEWADL